MINELIEQIGGREKIEAIATYSGKYDLSTPAKDVALMARALLAVLDAQVNSTIRKRKALLWLERQQVAHPGMNEVRYAIELITTPPAASVPDGWKLVPVNPTQEMLNAAWEKHAIYHPSAYRTMLESAPAPGGDGG